MTVTIEYSPDSLALIREQAAASNTTAEDFIRAASEKAARNAEYLAKIDRAVQSMREGRGTVLTDEQLRSLVYGNNI